MNDKRKSADKEKADKARQKRSDDLDEELEETFPASDPPAAVQPKKSRRK